MRFVVLRTTGIIVVFAVAAPAARAERPNLPAGWPEGWQRIGPAEGAAVAGLAGSAVTLLLVLKAPQRARWDGPVLFDDGVRNALRASSQDGRNRASNISDTGYLLAAYPMLVDAGLVTWLGRGQGDAAAQLALVDAEALAITSIVTTTLERTAGRARPFLRDCKKDPAGNPQCAVSANDGGNTSFVSGHTAIAFTAASTLCVQHSRISLYGGADAVVCPTALGIAAAVGLLRIVADKHWASDVIAGAAVGSTVGAVISSVHLRGDGPPTGLSLGSEPRSLVYWRRF